MVRIVVIVEEAGVELARGSVEHRDVGEAEVLAQRAMPSLCARAEAVAEARRQLHRAEREHVLATNRPPALRRLLPGCLRAAGLGVSYGAWGPATHEALDLAAEAMGVGPPPRRPQGWRRDMPIRDRWCELSARAVERIAAGEPVLGIDLEALDAEVGRIVTL